ncbi:hypothetical protein [Alkalicoccus chagannorensis]|uniref:hypothetical protein n=1 Tax=Alkalicoccus chagannorensis TaxID=427072 RepID=UPI00047C090F|nr:hypothetical protein [Alkalicoccus chagannorensis]
MKQLPAYWIPSIVSVVLLLTGLLRGWPEGIIPSAAGAAALARTALLQQRMTAARQEYIRYQMIAWTAGAAAVFAFSAGVGWGPALLVFCFSAGVGFFAVVLVRADRKNRPKHQKIAEHYDRLPLIHHEQMLYIKQNHLFYLDEDGSQVRVPCSVSLTLDRHCPPCFWPGQGGRTGLLYTELAAYQQLQRKGRRTS